MKWDSLQLPRTVRDLKSQKVLNSHDGQWKVSCPNNQGSIIAKCQTEEIQEPK